MTAITKLFKQLGAANQTYAAQRSNPTNVKRYRGFVEDHDALL